MPSSIRFSASDVRNLRAVQEAFLSPSGYASREEWILACLDRTKVLLRADKATLRLPINNGFRQFTRDIDDDTMAAYGAYYWKLDFGARIGVQEIKQHVWSRHRVYGKRLPIFYKSEFYADLVKPASLYDSLGISTIPGNSADSMILYLWHERQSGPRFGDRGLQLLRTVLPAFQTTAAVALGLDSKHETIATTIDALADAAAVADGEGRLLHANPALRILLASTPLLHAALERRATTLARRRLSRFHGVDDVLAVDELPGFQFHGCYVGVDAPRNEGQILIVVKPRRAGVASGTDAGLTPRELEVARLIAQRHTNREIAAILGVSIHTARHHAERVKRKLGARRRHDIDI